MSVLLSSSLTGNASTSIAFVEKEEDAWRLPRAWAGRASPVLVETGIKVGTDAEALVLLFKAVSVLTAAFWPMLSWLMCPLKSCVVGA